MSEEEQSTTEFPLDEQQEDEAPQGIRAFWQKHARKMWWVHSLYALGLGVFIATFAQRGYEYAHWLVVLLGLAWIFLLFFFRIWGLGPAHHQVTKTEKARFYVMTYVLKNLYQGMIFFMLPFYWRSGTMDGTTRWFLALLLVCALIATMDLVFDRILMRWHAVASFFYGMILFSCINLLIPALLPGIPVLVSLLLAAGVAVFGYWTLHLPLASLKDLRLVVVLCIAIGLAVLGTYSLRRFIPPVPLHIQHGAVGSEMLADGRMALEVTSVHTSKVYALHAATNVFVPSGDGEGFRHVWRRNGEIVQSGFASYHAATDETSTSAVRLFSSLDDDRLHETLVGAWSVDVETKSGQLVGRTRFVVFE